MQIFAGYPYFTIGEKRSRMIACIKISCALRNFLGRSSVNTTRLCRKTGGLEHQREPDAMHPVLYTGQAS